MAHVSPSQLPCISIIRYACFTFQPLSFSLSLSLCNIYDGSFVNKVNKGSPGIKDIELACLKGYHMNEKKGIIWMNVQVCLQLTVWSPPLRVHNDELLFRMFAWLTLKSISLLVFFLWERSLRILLTTRERERRERFWELWLCNLPLKEHNNMDCCYFKSSFQSLHHNSKHDPPCLLFLMCVLFKPLSLSQIFPHNKIPSSSSVMIWINLGAGWNL
jgi:hypothetical protein